MHIQEPWKKKEMRSLLSVERKTFFRKKLFGLYKIFFFAWRDSPQWARTSSLSRLHDHTQARHSRWESSGIGIGPTQTPLSTTDRHPCRRLGFEPAIPASERMQTHPLDCAVTGIGRYNNITNKMHGIILKFFVYKIT
jgi:hypothetical protein